MGKCTIDQNVIDARDWLVPYDRTGCDRVIEKNPIAKSVDLSQNLKNSSLYITLMGNYQILTPLT